MEDDVTKDLSEFTLANAIYAALVEGHACEISARYVHSSPRAGIYLPLSSRNAMDNASKNAGDMIASLQL